MLDYFHFRNYCLHSFGEGHKASLLFCFFAIMFPCQASSVGKLVWFMLLLKTNMKNIKDNNIMDHDPARKKS